MLITKTDEIKEYLSVSVGTDYNRLKPYIESAERDYILKLLGQEQYDELLAHYKEPGSSESLKALLVLTQKSLINLAYYIGYTLLSIKAGDQGFQRIESEKFKSLFKYQDDDLKQTFKSDGFNGLDQVLEYLENNIDKFPKFKESSNYTVLKGSLIPDTRTFDDIYDINNSRLVFLKLRRFMNEVEDLDLLPVIGSALLTRIKTELKKDTPDEKITALLPELRKPIPYLSIARGIKKLRINIADNGVFFESKESTSKDGNKRRPISDNTALVMAEEASRTGQQYLENLKDFLKSDAESYPEYIGSAPAVVRRDNNNKKSVWV